MKVFLDESVFAIWMKVCLTRESLPGNEAVMWVGFIARSNAGVGHQIQGGLAEWMHEGFPNHDGGSSFQRACSRTPLERGSRTMRGLLDWSPHMCK